LAAAAAPVSAQEAVRPAAAGTVDAAIERLRRHLLIEYDSVAPAAEER
jgi:hypothetical protein